MEIDFDVAAEDFLSELEFQTTTLEVKSSRLISERHKASDLQKLCATILVDLLKERLEKEAVE